MVFKILEYPLNNIFICSSRLFPHSRLRGRQEEDHHYPVHQGSSLRRSGRQHAPENPVPVLPEPVQFRLRGRHPGRHVQGVQRR